MLSFLIQIGGGVVWRLLVETLIIRDVRAKGLLAVCDQMLLLVLVLDLMRHSLLVVGVLLLWLDVLSLCLGSPSGVE